MSSIQDRHLRFAIAAQAMNQGTDTLNRYLTRLKENMGGTSVFYFSCFNPNGHYKLDLQNEIHREVAKCLYVINKGVMKQIAAKERSDRSQRGNQSCFRNESINGFKFEVNGLWKLPPTGILQFDFITFAQQPSEDQVSPEEDIQVLFEWFEMTNQQLTLAAKKTKDKAEAKSSLAKIGKILSECFRCAAEYFAFTSAHLGQFIDLIDDPVWRYEVFMAGVGRMVDVQNYDFIKHRIKY